MRGDEVSQKIIDIEITYDAGGDQEAGAVLSWTPNALAALPGVYWQRSEETGR